MPPRDRRAAAAQSHQRSIRRNIDESTKNRINDHPDDRPESVGKLGGTPGLYALGPADSACTGRSTTQVNVETPLVQAITPGGLAAEGIDVLYVNQHGSESSMNSDYMNLLKPEVALIAVGAGQGDGWYHPRADVVENVLLEQAPCITAPAVQYVFQTEAGEPTGATTSYAGYAELPPRRGRHGKPAADRVVHLQLHGSDL